jgi:hypothetical protein
MTVCPWERRQTRPMRQRHGKGVEGLTDSGRIPDGPGMKNGVSLCGPCHSSCTGSIAGDRNDQANAIAAHYVQR